ncbi:MAG: HPr family phosphocarrier protein [Planctomycetes bacterium]|nr:HPr family phosphocarrier protein [Planctomycetota bacterium]
MAEPKADNFAEKHVEILHEEGLHMRPAMQFVDCANNFQSKISIHKAEQVVDGKSIMQLTMLAATKGTQLIIQAEGNDAIEAVEALAKVLKDGSSEDTNQAAESI